MRKFYFFLLLIFVFTGQNIWSQCTNASQFGTVTAPTNTSPVTITTCAFAGEYSTINGAVAGSTYLFNATGGASNYITIRQGTPGGTVLGFGTPPLSVVCTSSGPLYLHYNTNAACGTDGSCHTGTITCTSCAAPTDPCTTITTIAACGTPTSATLAGAGVWNTTNCGFSTPGSEKIYSFTPATTGVYSLQVTSTNAGGFVDYFYKAASGGCSSSGWTCIDDIFSPGTATIGSLTAGTTYYFLLDAETTSSVTQTFQIVCLAPPPANDLCAGAITINCGQTLTGSTAFATSDAVATCGTTLNTAPGVWFTFAGDGSLTTLSLCASSYDTKIGVFSGSCGSLTCVTGNDDFCGLRSQVTFTAAIGTTYYVLVTGFGSASGNYSLTRTCIFPCTGVPSPGFITPTTSSVCAGTSVTLTLNSFPIATGLTFQWKEATTPGGTYTNITGATNTTYTFTAAATRYYVCTVTCTNPGGGAATTAEVVVNVSSPQHSTITATPNTNLCSPATSVITATATGGIGTYSHTLTGPGAIGAPVVSGANNANVSFTVTGIPAGVNTYTLVTTDGLGCSKTSTVNVTVNQTPIITLSTNPAAVGAPCTENFDGVTAPGLPAGWSALFGASCAGSVRWTTGTGTVNSSPNAAFTNDPNCISDEYLVSKQYVISAASQLSFSRSNNLENGFDGMVLEISIGGGPFVDIITAGGSFVAGAYNGSISGAFGNPLAGRSAWTGNTGGFITTTVNLPAAAVGQTVVLRWRRGTDSSVSGTGAFIDNISITNAGCGNVVICNGAVVRIDASAVPPTNQTFTNLNNTHLPAGGTPSGIAAPYPNTLPISGLPTTGVTVKSVTINNYSHAFPDDVDLVLVSPTGQSVILMSDAGGSADATGQTFVFDDAAPVSLSDGSFNASGTYKPTNFGAGDNWPAPGPGSAPTSVTLSSFTGNQNGNWQLYAFDDAGLDNGFIATWSITFNITQPVVFSPVTNLFSDAAATTAYTGAPAYTVWAKPTTTTTYTASSTIGGCSNSASILITVNQLPTITTQPTAPAAPVCPGFNTTFTVAATGTGITYQWERSTDNGTTWAPIVDDALHSGTTTNAVTVINPTVARNGHRYRVVVSGTCPPPVTSNVVILVVATPPTITTQPANRTVCAPDAAVFTVVAGGTPAPNIYQWQVSTNSGGSWTNLTTGGSFTPTLTVSPTATSQTGSLYRVIVTNTCGQSVTSSNATLTVNAPTTVTIAPLPTRICLSDTLVPLSASPVGGTWSGIGISGSNFVPSVTSIGSYTLTYTYVNAAGCTSTGTVVASVIDCPERIRQLDENAVILFPNPNTGRFNIRINSTLYNYLGMSVHNTAGQLLHRQTFNGLTYGRTVPVDLSHLPAGPYMVKIFYDDGIRTSEKTFPVIIQRQ